MYLVGNMAALILAIWCYSEETPLVSALGDCRDGEWKCVYWQQCIDESKVCDGGHKPDCKDESDEDPLICAQWDCSAGYWKCKDGLKCIKERSVCRGKDTCSDGSDEDPAICAQWDCSAGYWKCKDGLKCVKEKYVCDGKRWDDFGNNLDCQDDSDEDPAICAQWDCSAGYWKCKDGLKCVKEKFVCDGKRWDYLDNDLHCPDGSDEDPALCAQWNCRLGTESWKCNDGQCINAWQVCDGRTWYGSSECNDESDEDPTICAAWKCAAGYWKCKDGLKCIDESRVCDKAWDYDCEDESDEDPAICATWKCAAGYWKCKNRPKCIFNDFVCNGERNCLDKSDEDHALCTQWTCPSGYWKCHDGLECISENHVCDGFYSLSLYDFGNCYDNSDEDPTVCARWNCRSWMGDLYTKCADNLQCVKIGDICNSVDDCIDGTDELCEDACLKAPSINKWERLIMKRCPEDSSVCIPVKQYCDGIAQCPDAGDEAQSGCACEDWGLKTCEAESITQTICLNPDWVPAESLNSSELKCLATSHNRKTSMQHTENDKGLDCIFSLNVLQGSLDQCSMPINIDQDSVFTIFYFAVVGEIVFVLTTGMCL